MDVVISDFSKVFERLARQHGYEPDPFAPHNLHSAAYAMVEYGESFEQRRWSQEYHWDPESYAWGTPDQLANKMEPWALEANYADIEMRVASWFGNIYPDAVIFDPKDQTYHLYEYKQRSSDFTLGSIYRRVIPKWGLPGKPISRKEEARLIREMCKPKGDAR